MACSTTTDLFDCGLPSNLEDEQLHHDMAELPEPKPDSVLTRTSFQRMLAESMPIRLEISRAANRVTFDAAYEDILRLDARLSAILSRVFESFRRHLGAEDIFPSAFQQDHFECLQQRWVTILHIPLAARSAHDPRLLRSQEICVELANVLHSRIKRISSQRAQSCLSSFGGGIFIEDLAHACHILCSQVIRDLKPATHIYLSTSIHENNRSHNRKEPNPLLQKAEDILHFLRDPNSRWKPAVAVHIWLSMIVGYVRAADAGSGNTVGSLREGLKQALQYYASAGNIAVQRIMSGQQAQLEQQRPQQDFVSSDPAAAFSQSRPENHVPQPLPTLGPLSAGTLDSLDMSILGTCPSTNLLNDADFSQLIAHLSNEDLFLPDWFDFGHNIPNQF